MESYHYQSSPENTSHVGIVLIILLIIIVAGAVLYYYYYYRTPTTQTSGTIWKIVNGNTLTSDTFSASAGSAYLVNPAAVGSFQLQLIAPKNAVGQEFAVIHGGNSTVIISVANGNTYNLLPRTSNTFVWLSQNTFNSI
jgi:hypothetical protein